MNPSSSVPCAGDRRYGRRRRRPARRRRRKPEPGVPQHPAGPARGRLRRHGRRGVSGIDYDPATGVWYLISDDRWRYHPARFYTAELDIDPAGGRFSGVRLTGVNRLRRPDATAYPAFAKPESVDPESIRFDPLGDRLLWANEGDRADERNPDIPLSQGSLRVRLGAR